jgi:hypothetical protein
MKGTHFNKPVLLLLLMQIMWLVGIASLNAQSNPVGIVTVAWSPDGNRVAYGGANGLLRVRNVSTGQTLILNGVNGITYSVAWSPDSQRLVSAGDDRVIRVWNTSGTILATFSGHQDSILDLAWSFDGTKLASVSFEERHTLKVWDVINYASQPIGQQAASNSYAVEWSPDGSKIAVSSQAGLLIFPSALNVTNPTSYRVGAYIAWMSIAWNPTEDRIAVGRDNVISILNPSTQQEIRTINAHNGLILGLSWSPNGDRLASASIDDDTVKVWNANTGTLLNTFPNNSAVVPLDIAWNPRPGVSELLYGNDGENLASVQPAVLTPLPNLITNGDFSAGMNNWTPTGAPTSSAIVHQLTNGVFEFYRMSGSTSAYITQYTTAALPALAPLEVRLDLGNSHSTRPKRVSVVLHSSDWQDQQNCVFWLPPNAPLRTYTLRTFTTQAWSAAALSIYELTADSAGYVRVDNVSLRHQPGLPTHATLCVDPLAPAPGTGADGTNMVQNGDFSLGLQHWFLSGSITYQLLNGVLYFDKPTNATSNATVVNANGSIPPNTPMELTLDLGNSSASSRKRVTVILNEAGWTDSQPCNFWIPPNTPLRTYTVRTHTRNAAWPIAHISIYDLISGDPYIMLDNVSLRQRPSLNVVGVECYEPGAAIP